jgi:segregation and condensation protein B
MLTLHNTEIKSKEIIEALLFVANYPVPIAKLVEITKISSDEIIKNITDLNKEYEESGRAFRIEKVANGFQMATLPEFSPWIRLLYRAQHQKFSKATLETLAIIAYNQPITKAEIEKIRGVDSSGPLTTLLEKRLIQIHGRAKKPGRPFLYITTREFLRYFGLASLNDLPQKDEVEEFLKTKNQQ